MNEVAVITPAFPSCILLPTFISLEKVAIPETTVSLSIFPVTLPVTLPVKLPVTLPVTLPEKAVAVTMPDTFILPTELIPTPSPLTPPISLGFSPIWRVNWGFVVAIPTVPPVL